MYALCVVLLTVDENNELPADFDEEFFREIHQKGGMIKQPLLSFVRIFSFFISEKVLNAVVAYIRSHRPVIIRVMYGQEGLPLSSAVMYLVCGCGGRQTTMQGCML